MVTAGLLQSVWAGVCHEHDTLARGRDMSARLSASPAVLQEFPQRPCGRPASCLSKRCRPHIAAGACCSSREASLSAQSQPSSRQDSSTSLEDEINQNPHMRPPRSSFTHMQQPLKDVKAHLAVARGRTIDYRIFLLWTHL